MSNVLKYSAIALLIALIIVAMVLGKLLFLPLAWATLLTLMVLPVAKWWERRLKSRVLASIVTVTMLMVAIGGILFLLANQSMGLMNDAPEISEKIALNIDLLRHFADEKLGFAYATQPAAVKLELSAASKEMAYGLGNTLQQTLTTLGLMLVVPIYMFFLLRFRTHFFQFLLKIAAAKDKSHTVETVTKAADVVQKYLRGLTIEIVIVAVLVGILFLSLGIRHALFFAVLVALLNIIPYLGVFIGSTLSVVYTFFTTDSMIYPVLVFVLLWVIQIIDNNFVVPYVVGQQIKLNPLAIILVVVLGGLIWGVSGMILFIPCLGIAKVVLDQSKSMQHYGFLLGEK